MKPKEERKLRALIYCRVSGDKQEEKGTSLDSQESECREYALANGFEIVRTVRETYSGAYLFDRPLLNAERDKIRSGEYDRVIVHAVDRLSRNTGQMFILVGECEQGGAKLEFVKEEFEDTAEGRLLFSVKAYVAEIEREKIKERCVRGKRTKCHQGKLNVAMDLYGYATDRINKVRQINPAEAEIVKRIFNEYLNGKSIRGLANMLNDEGVPSPATGKRVFESEQFRHALNGAPRWGKTSIYRILTDPSYYGKSFGFKFKGESGIVRGRRFNRTVVRDKAEWIPLPDTVTPAIVTEGVWEAVQERLQKNRQAARPTAELEILFRGLVECATCGRPMYSERERGKIVYRCSSRFETPCGGQRISGEKCEPLVWNAIADLLRNPQTVQREVKRMRESGKKGRRTQEKDVDNLKASLVKVENDITRIARRAGEIEDEFIYKTFQDQLAAKRQERERLQNAIAEVEKNLEHFDAEQDAVNDFETYSKRVRRNLDRFGYTEKKMALDALNVKIKGNGKELRVYYSLPSQMQDMRSYDVIYRSSGIGEDDAGEAAAHYTAAARIRGSPRDNKDPFGRGPHRQKRPRHGTPVQIAAPHRFASGADRRWVSTAAGRGVAGPSRSAVPR